MRPILFLSTAVLLLLLLLLFKATLSYITLVMQCFVVIFPFTVCLSAEYSPLEQSSPPHPGSHWQVSGETHRPWAHSSVHSAEKKEEH